MSIDFFFIKTRPVKSPVRGTSESAGIDFFIPEDFEEVEVRPGSSVMIPSGIKCSYPPGYALILFNKSGIASKYKLTSLANVCDSDYHGEIHISLINVGKDVIKVSSGMKIAQFILVPVALAQPTEVENEETLWNHWNNQRGGNASSERGEGGFGSTGEF
jgi:dUTP pyrophosphatase